MTSHAMYNEKTEASEVVEAFRGQIASKISLSLYSRCDTAIAHIVQFSSQVLARQVSAEQ